MMQRDDCQETKRARQGRPGIKRRRQVRADVEPLEERSLLSAAGLASIREAHRQMLEARMLQLQARREQLIEARLEHRNASALANRGALAAGIVPLGSAARTSAGVLQRHSLVSPNAAADPLRVWWTYPNGGTTFTGDSTLGFFAIGFSLPINLSTLNPNNVQLSYQAPGTRNWVRVPAALNYNAGNNAVVIVPTAFKPDGVHIQPNGLYTIGIGPGLQSTPGTGSKSLGTNYYYSYVLNTSWGAPGHYPISLFAPNGNAPTIPNDPYHTQTAVAYAPGSGVIIVDQYQQLDRASVNASTVQLFHLNNDGSLGAQVPLSITYNNEIPSIEIAPRVAMTQGNYRFIEQGTVNYAGVRLSQPAIQDFYVPQSEGPAWNNQNGPIDVITTFPRDGSRVSVTDVASVIFTEPAVPSTVNSSTIQLERLVNGQWSAPLPGIAVNYNPGTYTAYLMPTQGLLSQGTQYRIIVNPTPVKNPIRGSNNVGVPNTMARTEVFTYTFDAPSPPTPPLINPSSWGSFPAPNSVVSSYPAAIIVSLAKWAGYLPWTINARTFQIYAVNANGQRISGPLDNGRLQVTWNPRAGFAVITMPDDALGDGRYVIVGNPYNPATGSGVVDLAGNVQKIGFYPAPFTITGTGRPQTLS